VDCYTFCFGGTFDPHHKGLCNESQHSMWSGSSHCGFDIRHAQDRERVIMGGANAYFRKSSAYDEFMKLREVIKEWFPKAPKT
jgi:hypothetical protein